MMTMMMAMLPTIMRVMGVTAAMVVAVIVMVACG